MRKHWQGCTSGGATLYLVQGEISERNGTLLCLPVSEAICILKQGSWSQMDYHLPLGWMSHWEFKYTHFYCSNCWLSLQACCSVNSSKTEETPVAFEGSFWATTALEQGYIFSRVNDGCHKINRSEWAELVKERIVLFKLFCVESSNELLRRTI